MSHNRLRAAAVAAALTLLAGCAGSRTSNPAQAAAPRLAPMTWDRTSSPDSIAAWALRGCGRAGAAKQACFEEALISTIKPAGVDKAMAALERVVAADQDVARDTHVYAHGIGIAAYTDAATVSQTFAKCTPAFQSGCYHGVIQAYFADAGTGGVSAERLNALCADYRSPAGRWLQFQCAHGAGHGLMAIHGHHLIRALEACDVLTDMPERSACWGGAFMENVVNATRPHHTATTQLAGGGHAGHGQPAGGHNHGQAAAGHDHGTMKHEPFKALDPQEPLYPCTIVADHHKGSCYLMQTSAILVANRADFAETARQCERAPEQYKRACFVSLGRDAAAYSRGDDARAVELCGRSPEARIPWCVIGTVKNRIDVTADPKDGLAFCRVVPGEAAKRTCYRAIGEQTSALYAAHPDRERACAAAEAPFVEECRSGAQLARRESTGK
jgi:hypothetical protein